jgi:hypothetical protein
VETHKGGPLFLNLLRVLDVPESLGLLLPDVKSTITGGQHKPFDHTAKLQEVGRCPGEIPAQVTSRAA